VFLTRRQSLVYLASGIKDTRTPANPAVAFHYAAVFSADAVRWYGRFSILVTGGILSPEQTGVLKATGLRLIAYDWSSAFYPRQTVPATAAWQNTALQKGAKWLLNSSPVPGASAEGGAAYWYDFGTREMLRARAEHLAEAAGRFGYDGFFFDTLGFAQLPPAMQNEFRRRHPGVDYEEMQGEFLSQLRRCLPAGKLIFTNQGYRNPEVYLAHADLDLSESYFTFLKPDGSTGFRRWWDRTAPWESIRTPMQELVVPAQRRFPKVRFVHLNYAGGGSSTVRRAIQFSLACARLWGHQSYVVAPKEPSLEADEVYFTDMGEPAESSFQEDRDAGLAWRVFQKAVVALNAGDRAARIKSLGLDLPSPSRGYVFPR
jgi:hypothetical protein